MEVKFLLNEEKECLERHCRAVSGIEVHFAQTYSTFMLAPPSTFMLIARSTFMLSKDGKMEPRQLADFYHGIWQHAAVKLRALQVRLIVFVAALLLMTAARVPDPDFKATL